MRRWFNALVPLLLLAPAASAAKKRPQYDPEVALMVLTIQKQSLTLLRDELARQAEWLGLGAVRVLLSEHLDEFAARVEESVAADSDILEEYRKQILAIDPAAVGETDRLVAEVRRYHNLQAGPPMTRLPAAKGGALQELLEEENVGDEVLAALEGTAALDEPLAYAERRFGTTGPFLRRRRWSLDFYLGSFDDLGEYYRRLGYRRVYRLRAPYVSYGKQAYVLAPEPHLRPRLVYCAFYGRDLFQHVRAQWATLTERASGEGPFVRTLTCPSCAWTLPGARAMRDLLLEIPYAPDNVIAGYDYLFEPLWKDGRLGVYENDYWRLTYYRTGRAVSVTVQPLQTNFGEILAEALSALVARGARRVYYAGPAARVDEALDPRILALPTAFVSSDGAASPFANAFLRGRTQSLAFAGLASPLYATREWQAAARRRKIAAFDGEMERLAQKSANWFHKGIPVECAIAAVLGTLTSLHPEEDRAIYTIDYADQAGKESAKLAFRDLILSDIRAAAKD